MKLVLEIDKEEGIETYPFQYSSKENAIKDFFYLYDKSMESFLWYDNWKKENCPNMYDTTSMNQYIEEHGKIYDSNKHGGYFYFLKTKFYHYSFSKDTVKIFELDEWFELNELNQL